MGWKTFGPEELVKIRQNPYVKSATVNMIRFTATFKEEFWREYHESGQSPAEIMRGMGFDPEIIGESRIRGIVQHLKEDVQSGETFRDVRKSPEPSVTIDADRSGKPLPPSKAMLRLQHEVAYLKQEMEFIKKIILSDREAMRKCSSKQDRK